MNAIQSNPNLSYRLAQELGRAISNGDYAPADALPTEADLCVQFGVSRTAVREAVKMLSAKGLISSKPRQGIRVLPEENWNILDSDLLRWSLEGNLSRAVLKEFFQLRVAIEPEAAALAASQASPQHVQAIADALERMKNASPDSEDAIEADVDFHTALLYATENRFYIRLRDFIRTALRVSIHFTTPAVRQYDEIIDEHSTILRAIQRGNANKARNCVKTLIVNGLAIIEQGATKR